MMKFAYFSGGMDRRRPTDGEVVGMLSRIFTVFLAVQIVGMAHAADALTEVSSNVYVAEGVAANDILDQAGRCIKSAAGNNANEVFPEKDGGLVYAVVKTRYERALLSWVVRSRINVYAKDGRYKISHTDIEQYNSSGNGYMPIQKYWGSGWQAAEEALTKWFPAIDSCMSARKVNQSDW